LYAEGTILHYRGPPGNSAIIVSGAYRCRLNFGTIWSNSQVAALAFQSRKYSSPFMPIDMNIIGFQGLQRVGQCQGCPVPPGVGILIQRPYCLNQITGTDVRGFNTGVLVDSNYGPRDGHTIDTNWYWLSYVRGCMTAIHVNNYNTNAQQWYVNVDIMNPGSVCIRTSATTEYWHIIMGSVTRDPRSRTLVLDPGAAENFFFIIPPLFHFDGYENNSGNWNNVFLQVPRNPSTSLPGNQTLQESSKKRRLGARTLPGGMLGSPQIQTHLIVPWKSSRDSMVEVDEEKVKQEKQRNKLDKLYKSGTLSLKEYNNIKTILDVLAVD